MTPFTSLPEFCRSTRSRVAGFVIFVAFALLAFKSYAGREGQLTSRTLNFRGQKDQAVHRELPGLSISRIKSMTRKPSTHGSWGDELATKYLQAMKLTLTGSLLRTPWLNPGTGNLTNLKQNPYDDAMRIKGLDWPLFGLTMVGQKRLENIQDLLIRAIHDDLPGDFVECGVWRGGASIFAKAVIEAYASRSRHVHLADSVEGLPRSTQARDDDSWSRMDSLKVNKDEIAGSFRDLGLLDSGVRFHKGFFRYSMPRLRAELETNEKQIAVLRMDGDMYESTMDILYNLYDLVPVGGCVIVDDWIIPVCQQAITEFRKRNEVFDEIVPIDSTGMFWCKTHMHPVDHHWYKVFNESRGNE